MDYYTNHDSDANEPLFGNLVHLDHHIYYALALFGICVFLSYGTIILCSVMISKQMTIKMEYTSPKRLQLQNRLLTAIVLEVYSSFPLLQNTKRHAILPEVMSRRLGHVSRHFRPFIVVRKLRRLVKARHFLTAGEVVLPDFQLILGNSH